MVEDPSQRGSGVLVDFGRTAGQTQSTLPQRLAPAVGFDRDELRTILNIYGRKVAAGEWRDYAMDFLRERALFSIYKRSSERPVYVIEKNPRLRNRQGQYQLVGQEGRILKRGHDLRTVLRVLDPQLALVK